MRQKPRFSRSARNVWPTSRCPKKLYVVDTIPRTATGKIQRGAVAEALARPRNEISDRWSGRDRRLSSALGWRAPAQDVTLFARGAHLRAMQEHGLRITSAEGDFEVHPRVIGESARRRTGGCDSSRRESAWSDAARAAAVRPLIGGDTTVVSTQNGIPWWYCRDLRERRSGRRDRGCIPAEARGRLPRLLCNRYHRAGRDPPYAKAIAFRWASRMARARNAARLFAEALIQAGLRCPVTRRIADMRSGSNCWATWRLIRSARSRGLRWLQMARDPEVCPAGSQYHDGSRGGGRQVGSRDCRCPSINASPARKKSASIRRRCCRIWKPGGRWSWSRWLAR